MAGVSVDNRSSTVRDTMNTQANALEKAGLLKAGELAELTNDTFKQADFDIVNNAMTRDTAQCTTDMTNNNTARDLNANFAAHRNEMKQDPAAPQDGSGLWKALTSLGKAMVAPTPELKCK